MLMFVTFLIKIRIIDITKTNVHMANTITQWKPQVSYTNRYNEKLHFSVKTYAEVKSRMKDFLQESKDNEVTVSRSRRGEWGEWFEYWAMSNGKPTITKQGWL